MAETIEAPLTMHKLTQQACCYKPAVAAAARRQLNGASTQWRVGIFSKWHRHGTDGQTVRWTLCNA